MVELIMYRQRGDIQLEHLDFWGKAVQPERWGAIERTVPRGVRILDIGAGHGAYTSRLEQTGYKPFGIDLRRYSNWQSVEHLRYAQADGTWLPFPKKYFYASIAFEVLEHCSDPQAVVNEMVRCSTHKIIVSVPDCALDNNLRRNKLALSHWTDTSHCNFFTVETIRALLESCELRVQETIPCFPISPNTYFWNSVKLPEVFRKVFKKIFQKLELTETYYSSILVISEVPSKTV